jgi:hypothetical protein
VTMKNKWKHVFKFSLLVGGIVFVVINALLFVGNAIIQNNNQRVFNSNPYVDEKVAKRDRNLIIDEMHEKAKSLEFNRNPFVVKEIIKGPVQLVPVLEGELSLQGISWDEKSQPQAIINGEIVELGSIVLKHTVIDIQQNHIILLKEDDLSLPLEERTIQLDLPERY